MPRSRSSATPPSPRRARAASAWVVIAIAVPIAIATWFVLCPPTDPQRSLADRVFALLLAGGLLVHLGVSLGLAWHRLREGRWGWTSYWLAASLVQAGLVVLALQSAGIGT